MRGWPVTLTEADLLDAPVGLRPVRVKDASVWRELRMRNAEWLRPWEPTNPETPLYQTSLGPYVAMARVMRREARQGQTLPWVLEYAGRFAGQLTVGSIVWGSARSAQVGYWVDQSVAGQFHQSFEDAQELFEQPEARLAPLRLEAVERARERGDDRRVGIAGECRRARARRPSSDERDRRLAREEAEQLHLLQREPRPLRAVEHLEHAEHAFLVEQRDGHHSLRDVTAPLGDVAREARVGLHVLEHERRP